MFIAEDIFHGRWDLENDRRESITDRRCHRSAGCGHQAIENLIRQIEGPGLAGDANQILPDRRVIGAVDERPAAKLIGARNWSQREVSGVLRPLEPHHATCRLDESAHWEGKAGTELDRNRSLGEAACNTF